MKSSASVPATLRKMIPSNPVRRKSLGTLSIGFVGDEDDYLARFMGGMDFDNLILTNERTGASRFVTSADLNTRVYRISCTGKPLPLPDTPEDMAWYFAAMFVARLASNMRRLRLGGNDPVMVFWKAWKEAWDLYGKSYDISKTSVSDTMEQGLQLVIDLHPYGPAITELQERARAKIAALCQEKEVLEDVV